MAGIISSSPSSLSSRFFTYYEKEIKKENPSSEVTESVCHFKRRSKRRKELKNNKQNLEKIPELEEEFKQEKLKNKTHLRNELNGSSQENEDKQNSNAVESNDKKFDRQFTLTKIKLEDMQIEKFDPKNIKIMNLLGLQTQILNKMKKLFVFSVICAFTNILLVIVDNEIRWTSLENQAKETIILVIIRSISFLLCITQCILIIIESRFLAKLNRVKKIYPEDSSIFNIYEFPPIVIECIISFFHIPPFLIIFSDSGKLNYLYLILTLLTFLKIYLISKVVEAMSPTNSQKGKFIGSLRGIGFSKSFIFKSWIKENEFLWLLMELVIFVLICGYLAYIFDRPQRYLDINSNYYVISYPFNYFDYIWLLLITFTTVGLGDYYPVNHESRIFCIIGALGGIIYIASLIGIIHSNLKLSEDEERVFAFLNHKDCEKQFKNQASKMICSCLKLSLIKRKFKKKRNKGWKNSSEYNEQLWLIYNNMNEWKDIKFNRSDGKSLQCGLDIFHDFELRISENRGKCYFLSINYKVKKLKKAISPNKVKTREKNSNDCDMKQNNKEHSEQKEFKETSENEIVGLNSLIRPSNRDVEENKEPPKNLSENVYSIDKNSEIANKRESPLQLNDKVRKMALKLKQRNEAKMKKTNTISTAEIIRPIIPSTEKININEDHLKKDIDTKKIGLNEEKDENKTNLHVEDHITPTKKDNKMNELEIEIEIETLGTNKFENDIKRNNYIKEKAKTNPLLGDKLFNSDNKVGLDIKNDNGTTLSKINSIQENKNDTNLFEITKKKFELSKEKLGNLKLKIKEIRTTFLQINQKKVQTISEIDN